MKIAHTILLLLACHAAAAQSGHITGIVLNEKEQPIINASVYIYRNGKNEGAALTGLNGDYIIKPLGTGRCRLLFTHPGYDTLVLTGIAVKHRSLTHSVKMAPRH